MVRVAFDLLSVEDGSVHTIESFGEALGNGEKGIRLLAHGDYVRCAVTGPRISLDELRDWCVARQEPPYANATASLERERRNGEIGR